MKRNLETSELLKNVFLNNWNEVLIYDTLGGYNLTYKSFFNQVIMYSKKLEEIGFRKGDILCLVLPNSLELLLFYIAAFITQLTVVPVDPMKGENEIREILTSINYKYVICESLDIDFIEEKKILKSFKNDVNFSESVFETENLCVFDTIDYNGLFLITFTSGTTGVSKGVMHSMHNLISSAIAFKEKCNFDNKNVFYHNLPMTYMAGILNLFILPLVSGSRIVLGERFSISNAVRFWEMPIKYAVNTFWFTPTMVSLISKLDRGLEGINYAKETNIIACVGTAPLGYQVRNTFEKKYSIGLFESYGLSELLFISTNYPGHPYKENCVGQLLKGVELVFSKDGEILVDVPWMFLGYSNVETESYFTNNRYCTGDLGVLIDEDFLVITGRKKDLIIKGGTNISPKKIENFINEFGIFEEFTVMGIDDNVLGEKIVCFYVARDIKSSGENQKALNGLISKKLGRDYCIDQFIELKEIAKNINGKIDKLSIKGQYYKDILK